MHNGHRLPGTTGSTPELAPAVLAQAAQWLVLLQSGEASEQDHAELARWCARNPAHAAAWQRAQRMLASLGSVPAELGRQTLLRPRGSGRRKALGLFVLAAPTGWLAWRLAPWPYGPADLATATGEQKTVVLADGSRLVLDTRSAVNLHFGETQRKIALLGGTILVTSSVADPWPTVRPLVVHTPHGRLRALGTRFMVSCTQQGSALAVFDGAVHVQLAQASEQTIVHAGGQIRFTTRAMAPVQPVDSSAALWERGLLLARDMRLDQLLAQLGRYQLGRLRCDPAVAGLLVSGAFPLTDTQASLELLEKSLPVRVVATGPGLYWLTVKAR